MLHFIQQNKWTCIGIITGAIAGFLYWKLVGCSSGTCAISSSPINSSVYGGTMGGLAFSLLKKQAPRK